MSDAGHRLFPPLQGRALNGTDTTVPDDLLGERNLVVVAFRQWQQRLVDGWLDWAVDELGLPRGPRSGPYCLYEVPVLGRQWRVGRRLIDGGMASAIGDPEILARTITVYTHVGQVARGLAIDSLETVHAFVVTPAGAILAHQSGDSRLVDRDPVQHALVD